MIRVLQVLSSVNRAGAETMIMDIYRQLDKNEIQFDFVVHTFTKCDYEDEIMGMGGKIYRVQYPRLFSFLTYCLWWVKFFLLHKEYYIVHGHIRTTAFIYLGIAKIMGRYTIAHSHSTSSGKGVNALFKNLSQLPIKYIADFFMGCSVSANQWLFGNRISKSKRCIVLPNSIKCEKYRYKHETAIRVRHELGLDGKFIIGNIGRFVVEKNHCFLLEIFKKINLEHSDSVLLLVGNWSIMPEIKQKTIELGISKNVVFTGVRSDIPELLCAMDVFIFPSLYEGLGIVLIEAQASGLYVLTSDTIPKEAFITDHITPLSLNAPPETWANIAIKYASGYVRYDMTNEVKAAGYDVDDVAGTLVDIYTGILKNKIININV